MSDASEVVALPNGSLPFAEPALASAPLHGEAAFALDSPMGATLLEELREFRESCCQRYAFNNRWDVVLSVLGLMLSIAIVAVGVEKLAVTSAILGALVGAVVTAQKAFPFGQRALFYRLLIGQTDNLLTSVCQGFTSRREVVNKLSALRMDFAQQLPRGSNISTAAPNAGSGSGISSS